MTASPVIPLIAALIGAAAGGLFQAIIRIWDRWDERKTIFVAIASEVESICVLVRTQRYLESVQEIVAAHGAGTWDGEPVIVDVRSEALAPACPAQHWLRGCQIICVRLASGPY